MWVLDSRERLYRMVFQEFAGTIILIYKRAMSVVSQRSRTIHTGCICNVSAVAKTVDFNPDTTTHPSNGQVQVEHSSYGKT